MAPHGRELSSIDFESMLGGPLSAVVNAQAQAAMTTVTFIKEVGFEPESSDDQEPPALRPPGGSALRRLGRRRRNP